MGNNDHAGESMGQTLQRLRVAADELKARAGGRSGVPSGTLKNWEQDRKVPRLDTAVKVAVALGASLDVLTGIAGETAQAEMPVLKTRTRVAPRGQRRNPAPERRGPRHESEVLHHGGSNTGNS